MTQIVHHRVKLWLEFEQYVRCEKHDEKDSFCYQQGIHTCNDFFDDSHKKYDDFCNVLVNVDGKKYALNVWTYNYFATALLNDKSISLYPCFNEHLCLFPPDLFVEKLERDYLQKVFDDLVENNQMKKEWTVKYCKQNDREKTKKLFKNNTSDNFKLWLEFENQERCEDNDCCFQNYGIHACNEFLDNSHKKFDSVSIVNVKIGKKRYALDLWTYNYFAHAVIDHKVEGNQFYVLPPDLFVEKLERPYLETLFASLLKSNSMKKEWSMKFRKKQDRRARRVWEKEQIRLAKLRQEL